MKHFTKCILSFVLTLAVSSTILAQERTVSGTITDADTQAPLPGANVLVKGTTHGTLSDANGFFSIAAEGDATLVFSYIGFITQEIHVGELTTINVAMSEDARQLSEVVVVGYGQQQRSDVTGSIGSISSEEIEKVPVTTLDQALQGRVAGVNVINNDAAPGNSVQVQIRGIGSLGSNSPLYVVDGYPISGDLSNINPSDIASIDILKDASASAIYGNRAANGVVIVTTKRGKEGIQISFDASTSLQSEPDSYNVLDAEQWATLANQLSATEGFITLPEWSNPASLRSLDWQDALYQTGLRQNYNLGIRGGSEKVQSAFSFGYLDHEGVILGSEYERFNFSLNLDYEPYTWLKSSTSVKYTRSKNDVPFGTQSLLDLSSNPPSMTGNRLTDQIKDDNGNYGFYTPTHPWLGPFFNNPVYFIETRDQDFSRNYVLASSSLEVEVVEGLKVKTNFGINFDQNSGFFFTPSDTRAEEQYGVGIPTSESFYSQSSGDNFEWLWENTVSYTKSFGNHNIDVVAGISAQENTFRDIGIQGTGSVSDVLRNVAAIQTVTNQFGGQTTISLASQFGRINYKFMDKYYITATVRRDGSSKFGPDNKYGVFPSASVAWRVKEESFLQDVSAIADLKIRASYGEVGNQGSIGPFQYLSTYTSGGPQSSRDNLGYPFNKVYQPGIKLSGLPNPDLTWETTKMTDIGMDMAFMDGALNVTLDYYIKESEDFLLNIPVPSQTGFTTAARNVGSIRNSGLEVNLYYRKATSNDFTYGVNLVLSTVNNELLSLADGLTSVSNLDLTGSGLFENRSAFNWAELTRTVIGGPLGEFYGFQSDGVFQTQEEIDQLNAAAEEAHGQGILYQGPGVAAPGDRKFMDLNGDAVVNADDRTAIGSPIPDVVGSLSFDATYKAFDFSIMFYGVTGNEIFNFAAASLEDFGALSNISQEYVSNAWTPTNPSNRYTRVTTADFQQNVNTRPSEVYVEDGSYLRLKNLQIGYTMPAIANGIGSLRVYLTAQNLFTITKYSGLDPEIGLPQTMNGARNVSLSGIDVGNYPTTQFYGLGVNVTF